jgi:fibronectin-binding autotransporter adhesin
VQPGSVTVNATNNSYTFQDVSGTGVGKISGPGGITKNGPSTLTILALNNNSGPTVINGGTVQVGNGSQNGDIGTGNITDNGALIFQQTDDRSVAGAISGSGSLTQQGAGTLTLAQDNSYTGPTTISSGALQVGTGDAAVSISPADVTDNGTLLFNRSGNITVPNNITGSGAFATLGSSAIDFRGALTYLGNTFISNGLVRLTAPNQIPNGSSVVGSTGWLILDGSATRAGTLDLNGFDQTVNALSGLGGTLTGVITNSGTSTTATNVLTVLGTAGTTYNGVIADNASGAKTMLVLRGANELRLNGNNTYSGGTIVGDSATIGFGLGGSVGSGTLTMSNGTTLSIHNQGGSGAFPAPNVVIPDNATITNFTTSTGNGFGGTITGSETTTNIVTAAAGQTGGYSISSTTKQLQPFLGTLLVPADQTLRWSGSSGLNNGGDFTTLDLEGSMNSKNRGTVTFGALIGAGTIASPSGNSGTVTWIVGGNNNDSTFSGTITDNATAHNALTKVGTGKLSLTGSVNYSGDTTISNGVLALASDSVSLDNSPNITLAGDNATIDVTGHSDPTLYLGNVTPQVLNGFGIINGNLFEQINTTNNLRPGVLRVTQTATINGALTMQINRTNAVNSAELSAPTFVNGGSIILTVANVGSTNLVGGDKFQLFNQAFTGDFVATNLPALPLAGMYWTNNIAVDGSISVVSTVATNPTNITMSATGGVLNLSWPADHQGWTLQQNTNLVTPNWQDVPGSTGINSTNITIDPNTPSIFYRLKL